MVTRHTIQEKKRQTLRILLAEDNPVNQKLAVILLTKAGYSVDVVDNGARAVDAVVNQNYNVVLMDVQMPELDGLEATRRIRKLEAPGRHVPIIAVTAHAMQGDRERCLEAGMDDYISKPLQRQELLAALERWIKTEVEELVLELPKNPGEGSTRSADAVIDLESALPRFSGDMAFLLELLNEFIRQVESGGKQMREAASSGDAESLFQLAHSLKGAAGAFSAKRLMERTLELEQRARTDNLSGVETLIAQMEAEAPLLKEFLEQHKKTSE